MKRVFALVSALLLVLSLGGCIRKPDDSLMTAAENMENYNSLSFEMNMNITAEQNGESTPFILHAFSRIMNEEGLMHMRLDMNLAGKQLAYETYRQQKGFESTEYKGVDVGEGMEWTQEEGSILNIASVIPSGQVLKYISQVHKTEETAEIDGRICEKYEGIIAGPKLKLLMKLVSLLGEPGKEISAALSGKLAELKIPVSLYLDSQDPVIVQIHVDAAELIDAAKAFGENGIPFTSAEFTVQYGDFNEITEIHIPQEVLDAAPEAAE